MSIVFIFAILWIVRTLKSVLFWIYLWQLKEYHIGRFLDHFRTNKGKKIFLNFFFLLKIIALVLFLFNIIFAFYILFFLYLIEVLLLFARKIKKPVWTIKTIILTFFSFILVFFYLFYAEKTYNLLVFDILTPFIISGVVLIFQPFFVIIRNSILKKAKNKISQFKNLNVIAITGSYGKTSTKEFLQTILSSRLPSSNGQAKFKVLATRDHKNSEMGIAETILRELKPEHEIFIVEMGAYNKGGIKLLCDIVKPKIGIVTGVNEQHLATFGSMEKLLSAEGGGELLANLPQDGLLIVNGDNKYCLDLYKKAKIYRKIYTLNNNINSDMKAEEITIHQDYLDFMAITKEKQTAHINAKVLGKHNVQNLLGAMLTAKELEINMEEISLAVKNIRQEQAGIKLKRGVNGINIIDSSYSSNPDGVAADLDYLNIFSAESALGGKVKKVIVMPCLIELGAKSAEIHKQIGKKIAEVCDMAIITTKDKFEEIKNGAIENGINEKNIIFLENSKEIMNLITDTCKQEDAILLEGRVNTDLIKLLIKNEKTPK